MVVVLQAGCGQLPHNQPPGALVQHEVLVQYCSNQTKFAEFKKMP